MKAKPTVRTTTSAEVTVTLRLSNLGSWGPDCQIDQVYRQAREAAFGRIVKAFEGSSGAVRVVGEVTVKAITTDLEQRN